MSKTNSTIVIFLVLVALLIGILLVRWSPAAPASIPIASSTPATSSTALVATSTRASATVSAGPGYTIKPIYATGSTPPPAPDYASPLMFSGNVSSDVQTVLKNQFQQVTATLAKQPTDYNSWMLLATVREEAGDIAGAEADWIYVTKLYPHDPTAFGNLGDLYANYLHRNSDAISAYKHAIALDSNKEVLFYENLAQVYITMGDTASARATLEQGISSGVVGAAGLQTMLSSLPTK